MHGYGEYHLHDFLYDEAIRLDQNIERYLPVCHCFCLTSKSYCCQELLHFFCQVHGAYEGML